MASSGTATEGPDVDSASEPLRPATEASNGSSDAEAKTASGDETTEVREILREAERPLTYASVVLGLEVAIAGPVLALLTLVLRVSLWPATAIAILTATLVIVGFYLYVALKRLGRITDDNRELRRTIKSVSGQLSVVAKAAGASEKRHQDAEQSLQTELEKARNKAADAQDETRKVGREWQDRLYALQQSHESEMVLLKEAHAKQLKGLEDERQAQLAAAEKREADWSKRVADVQARAEKQLTLERASLESRIAGLNSAVETGRRAVESERLSTQRAGSAPIIEPFYRNHKSLFSPLRHWIGVRNLGAGPAENVNILAMFRAPTGVFGLQTNPFFPAVVPGATAEVQLDPSVFARNPTRLELTVTFSDVYGQVKQKQVAYDFH